jgi:hypothetical protein
MTLPLHAIAAVLLCGAAWTQSVPESQTGVSNELDSLIRAAISRGQKYKNELDFFDHEIARNTITKRNMVTATKQTYALNDFDRIAYAAAYGNGHLKPLTLENARLMIIDSVLVVVKISAWGSVGIAETIRRAKDSIVVVTGDGKRIPPSAHTMWVGSVSDGLPIYQATAISSGNSSLIIWNMTGAAFAHGTIYLSSLFLAKDVRDLKRPALAVFRLGDTKRLSAVSLDWLLGESEK